MKKKTILQVLCVFLVLAGSLNLIANTIMDSYTPKEIDDLISRSKTDEKLLEKIGEYEEDRFSYNYGYYDMGMESPFEVIIFGDKATATFRGKLRKMNEKWGMVEVDTLFKSY